MKIILISEYNILLSIGGTESYIDMLLKGLLEREYDVVLITKGKQKTGTVIEYYTYGQFQYKCVFLAAVNFSRAEIQQRTVSSNWYEMLPILLEENPDIIHVHTYNTFFNIRHFEKCKENFANIFFTSHIPAHFCPQGDLIAFNKKPCNGILYNRCSFCLFATSFKKGMSNLLYSNWQKALDRLRKLNSLGIHLVSVSDWQKQHAINNGFAEDQIHVIRQAILTQNYKLVKGEKINREFTIGFLGRLSPEKGASFLLKIISKLLKTSNFRFVLGIPVENCNPAYVSLLRNLSLQAGARITILENITASNKELFFNQLDCLLIPSFFIETGPIVLLESLLFNKKVIAPDIGGPLEYTKEFGESIIKYKWNNLQSVLQSIERASKAAPLPESSNYYIIKEKESSFTKMHEDIYRKATNKQNIILT